MNFANLTVAVCMTLCATLALAQDVAVPEREQRRGMSYEEYSSVRENMRLRMEKIQDNKRKQAAARESRPEAKPVRPVPDSAYGQGYQARNRPDTAAVERPERVERPARIERFNRGEMMRR